MNKRAKAVAPVLKLVPVSPFNHKSRAPKTSDASEECADELRYLLEEAESGELTVSHLFT